MTETKSAVARDRPDAKPASEKEKLHIGRFQARYLWPLLPFVKHSRMVDPLRFFHGNIGLEPCAEGGAYLVAVTGHATVMIRDPEAWIAEPVILDIPDAAFAAAKPMKMPDMTYEGESYRVPTPETVQPAEVYVSSAGIFVTTKMRDPGWVDEDHWFYPALFSRTASVGCHTVGLDYRLTESRLVDWRGLLRSINDAPPLERSTLSFNPAVPALFTDLADALFDHAASRSDTPHFITTHTMTESDRGAFVILRFGGHPDIVGLWASQVAATPHPIPAHFLRPPDPAPEKG